MKLNPGIFDDEFVVFAVNKPQNYAPKTQGVLSFLSNEGFCKRECVPSPCTDMGLDPVTGEQECFSSQEACECYFTKDHRYARCDTGTYCFELDGTPCQVCSCQVSGAISECKASWFGTMAQYMSMVGDFSSNEDCSIAPPPQDYNEEVYALGVDAQSDGEYYYGAAEKPCCNACEKNIQDAAPGSTTCCDENNMYERGAPDCMVDGAKVDYVIAEHPTRKCPDGTKAKFCYCPGQINWKYECVAYGGEARCEKTRDGYYATETECKAALESGQSDCGVHWACENGSCLATKDEVSNADGVFLLRNECKLAVNVASEGQDYTGTNACLYNIKCSGGYCINTTEPVDENNGIFAATDTAKCDQYCQSGYVCTIMAGDVSCVHVSYGAKYYGPTFKDESGAVIRDVARENCERDLASGTCSGVKWNCTVKDVAGVEGFGETRCVPTTSSDAYLVQFDSEGDCNRYCSTTWECRVGKENPQSTRLLAGCYPVESDNRNKPDDRFLSQSDCLDATRPIADAKECVVPTKYECNGSGECVESTNPGYADFVDKKVCEKSCGAYSCSFVDGKHACVPDPNGTFADEDECKKSSCGKFVCTGGNCSTVGAGYADPTFPLEANCSEICGKYLCLGDGAAAACVQYTDSENPPAAMGNLVASYATQGECQNNCLYFKCATEQKNNQKSCERCLNTEAGAIFGYSKCLEAGCGCLDENGDVKPGHYFCEVSKKCIPCEDGKSVIQVKDNQGNWIDCECGDCNGPKMNVQRVGDRKFCCDPCPSVTIECPRIPTMFPNGVFDGSGNDPCHCCTSSTLACLPPGMLESGKCHYGSANCNEVNDGNSVSHAISYDGCTPGYRECVDDAVYNKDTSECECKPGKFPCTRGGKTICIDCDPENDEDNFLVKDCRCGCKTLPANCKCGINRKTCECKEEPTETSCAEVYYPYPGTCWLRKKTCPAGQLLWGFQNIKSRQCTCKCLNGNDPVNGQCFNNALGPLGPFAPPEEPERRQALGYSTNMPCGPNATLYEGFCYCNHPASKFRDGTCLCSEGYAVGKDGITCVDPSAAPDDLEDQDLDGTIDTPAESPKEETPRTKVCEDVICPPGQCCHETVFGFDCRGC